MRTHKCQSGVSGFVQRRAGSRGGPVVTAPRKEAAVSGTSWRVQTAEVRSADKAAVDAVMIRQASTVQRRQFLLRMQQAASSAAHDARVAAVDFEEAKFDPELSFSPLSCTDRRPIKFVSGGVLLEGSEGARVAGPKEHATHAE
eukprot:TRINITY_DN26659_c0_g2_i2.p1 TRINITY_DN26659_c0_g2~~TRINITY_DN26659_c0_g2_i2.p1  ORF type:complete len:144 (+),score=9.40 TRINITY_DN26659_c0_g2_i2:397-828(+)